MTTGKPDQRGADHGRGARRRWRGRFDSWLPLIVAVMLSVLAVMSVVSVAAFSGNEKAKRALKRQALTARNGCERVQLIRDDVNVTSWGVYAVLNQPQPTPADLAGLFARLDPDTRAVLTALVTAGQDGRDVIRRVRDEQRYLPPTDCVAAAKNPRYRFPRAVPFDQVADCYDPDRRNRIRAGRCRR